MPVSLDYVARETASNLWRNRLMTIAAVLTVAVSLSLVGSSLLLQQGVAHATAMWQHGVSVEVFLKPSVSNSQRASIQGQLRQLPYVESCLYRSKQYDYNEAKHLLTPDESQALTVATTPASYRCVLNNPSQAQAIAKQFDGYPGVRNVASPTQSIRNMESVTKILRWVFLALAVILLLSASVLILNTIRLAIFARRREVSVMKLVGATNWFIRLPFMFEGVIQGLLGAVVAAAVVVVLHLVLDALGNSKTTTILYQMRVSTHEVVGTSLVVLLVGVLIGSVGSAFGIRRFLDT
ncbi:MAG TPA: permease-like cell division protein FtsX [Acidimicrobiales bacterium]|nr:permease-like cell division protein FtsX [Acidimicrobiales bacterium]